MGYKNQLSKGPKMPGLLICMCFVLVSFVAHAQCDFKPIGHRGGSSYNFPENTLVSLEQGFMEDIYAAEVDVRLTADSALVLMHDYYVDRTTNGSGEVEFLTLAYLKTLDAGSWKSSLYKDTPVPTLKEALLLANRFHKKLYLNMKVFAPVEIANTLQEANLPGDIILLDPDDLQKVKTYHEILPNTPLVYFGELPQNLEDNQFYSNLKDNGVIAIEIPADYICNSSDYSMEKLRDMAHSNSLQLWAYTVNDPAYFEFLKTFGIDGLETDRPSEAYQVFCNNAYGGFFPEKRITGQWDFNNSLQGTIGSKLVLIGDSSTEGQKIEFGSTRFFNLPSIDNIEVNVARIPAFDSEHALRFFSNIAPEGIPGGLDCDNTYTLIFDLLKPAGNNQYTSILQTSNNNSDDADLFLLGEANKSGIQGEYQGGFADSTWVRLILVFDLYNQKLLQYLNGNYIGTVELVNSMNGRFCLNNNWGVQSSNFFSDNDGETNPVFISSIQIRNYAMSPDEVLGLGKPKATKIEHTIVPNADVPCPVFANDIKQITDGNKIYLHADAGDRVNYKWEIKIDSEWRNITDTLFRNSASSTLGILNSPKLSGQYMLRCIAYNDCKTISNEHLLNMTEVEQVFDNHNDQCLVSPNPSNGSAYIDFSKSAQPYDIHIYTADGIEAYKKYAVNERCEVQLIPGAYICHVRNRKQTAVKKFLVFK